MHIGLVGPLWAPVPPTTYGGTELLVHLMADRYVDDGHHVTLFAAADSKSRANLRFVSSNLIEMMAAGEAYEYEPYANALLCEAIEASGDFDVLHTHLGFAQVPLLNLARCPVVHTMHIAPSRDDVWAVLRAPEVAVVGVSHAQVRPLIDAGAHNVSVIHSGCDFDSFDPADDPGSYLAFLGRMGPGKNPLGAIEIARACDLPLVLAGRPQNRDEIVYFDDHIRPLVDDDRVRFIGAVGHAEKNELLRNAAALLFPIVDIEAFGLVMIEAMACGTPVVARRFMSVAEIVDDGITGYSAPTIEELPELVHAAFGLDRRLVRAHAQKRFSHDRMADEYLALYASVAARP